MTNSSTARKSASPAAVDDVKCHIMNFVSIASADTNTARNSSPSLGRLAVEPQGEITNEVMQYGMGRASFH